VVQQYGKDVMAALRIHAVCLEILEEGATEGLLHSLLAALDGFLETSDQK